MTTYRVKECGTFCSQKAEVPTFDEASARARVICIATGNPVIIGEVFACFDTDVYTPLGHYEKAGEAARWVAYDTSRLRRRPPASEIVANQVRGYRVPARLTPCE